MAQKKVKRFNGELSPEHYQMLVDMCERRTVIETLRIIIEEAHAARFGSSANSGNDAARFGSKENSSFRERTETSIETKIENPWKPKN